MMVRSSTWLRSSRAQLWFRATMVENISATHAIPPLIWRESSISGSKANANTTTTSSAKNNIEFAASFERHSRRMSFRKCNATVRARFIARLLARRLRENDCERLHA